MAKNLELKKSQDCYRGNFSGIFILRYNIYWGHIDS